MKLKTVSDYDERGNLVQRIGYGSNGTPLTEETYRYDDKDNVIESVWNGVRYTYAYKYNSSGQAVEAKKFGPDGTLKQSAKYTVDERGQRTESVSDLGTGEPEARHAWRYDAAGNMIEYSKFTADGRLVEKDVHTFKSKNMASQTLIYDANGNFTKTIYEYEGDHLRQQSSYTSDGRLLGRNTYKRDQKGFVVEDLQTNEKGEPVDRTTSEYEFYP